MLDQLIARRSTHVGFLVVLAIALAPGHVEATCGDYLTIHPDGATVSNSHLMYEADTNNSVKSPLSDPSIPCHGPNCSRGYPPLFPTILQHSVSGGLTSDLIHSQV